MRGMLLPLVPMLALAQTPATNTASAVRHVFNGTARAPDGRLQYLFTTENPTATNRVFMGESIGGRQLLAWSPNTRELTLATASGNQTRLAAGESFTQQKPNPPVVASTGDLPQESGSDVSRDEISNRVSDLVFQSVSRVSSGRASATSGTMVLLRMRSPLASLSVFQPRNVRPLKVGIGKEAKTRLEV